MNRFEKWCLWSTAALATLSGSGLLWTKYLVHSDDPWAVINHPLQPWFLKAHIVTVPLLIFAIGLIATRHIWHHYREGIRRARRSGLLTALSTLPMILSGYLIQVVTQSDWLRVVAIAHIALGLLFALGLALHQTTVRLRLGRFATTRATQSEAAQAAERRAPSSRPAAADPEIFAGRGQ